MGDCKWHRCLCEPQRERVTYDAAFYRGDDGGYLPSLKGQSGLSIKATRTQTYSPQFTRTQAQVLTAGAPKDGLLVLFVTPGIFQSSREHVHRLSVVVFDQSVVCAEVQTDARTCD